jgi:hypothetical protein
MILKLARELDFSTEEEYFDYIMESKINGQHAQARGLFHKMEPFEKAKFFDYVEELYYYEAHDTQPDFSDEMSEFDLLKIYFNKR